MKLYQLFENLFDTKVYDSVKATKEHNIIKFKFLVKAFKRIKGERNSKFKKFEEDYAKLYLIMPHAEKY